MGIEEDGARRPIVGGYTWDTAADVGWWTPGMYRLHGLRPGHQEPTSWLFLQQVHEEDRLRVEEWLVHLSKVEGSFAFDYRVSVEGSERTVTSQGVSEHGPAQGMLVTGHAAFPAQGRVYSEIDRLRAEVHNAWAARESLADIERAKGAIMLASNCGDSAAFQVLASVSQQTNIKVREIALYILAVVTEQDTNSLQPKLRRTIFRELLKAKGELPPSGQ